MRITITHFRCYVETRVYDFPPSVLSLLKGTSGIGKSTVFSAIMWCLFGGMTKIKPNAASGGSGGGGKDQPTVVVMELPEARGIVITRTSPNILEVRLPLEDPTAERVTLTADAAQGYIDRVCGHRTLWLSSSYISQGMRNPMLTVPNADRFKILHDLTFGCESQLPENTPDYYLERLDEVAGQAKTYYTTELGRYNGAQDMFNRRREQSDISAWPVEETLAILPQLQATADANRERLTELHTNLTQPQVAEAQHHTMRQLERHRIMQLEAIPSHRDVSEIHRQLMAAREIRQASITWRTWRDAKDKLDAEMATLVIPSTSLHDLQSQLHAVEAWHRAFLQHGYSQPVDMAQLAAEADIWVQETEAMMAYERHHAAWQQMCHIMTATARDAHAHTCAEIRNQHDRAVEAYRGVQERNTIKRLQYEGALQAQQAYQARFEERAVEYERLRVMHGHETERLKQVEAGFPELQEEYRAAEAWWQQQYPHTPISLAHIEERATACRMLLQELVCPVCGNGVTLQDQHLVQGHNAEMRSQAHHDLAHIRETESTVQAYERVLIDVERERRNLQTLGPLPDPPTPFKEMAIIPLPEYETATTPSPLELPAAPTVTLPEPPIRPTSPGADPRPRLYRLQQLGPRPEGDVATIKSMIAIMERHTFLSTQLSRLPPAPPQMEEIRPNIVEDLEAELEVAQRYATQRQLLMEQTVVVPDLPLCSSDEITRILEQLTESQGRTLNMLTAGVTLQQLHEDYAQIEDLHAQLLHITNYEAALNTIRETVKRISTQSLDGMVEAINTSANAILKDIFDDPITIVLATYKELKTREHLKLQINIQISYRGAIYDGPSSLSGGEQDRLSLALTLAIARVSGSPILLLDECMASLDDALRDRCIGAIRKFMTHTTIIHICHEGIQGHHDLTIEAAPLSACCH